MRAGAWIARDGARIAYKSHVAAHQSGRTTSSDFLEEARNRLACDPPQARRSRLQAKPVANDQNSAITATPMSAVPTQPSTRSHGVALKRPISFRLDTITIIMAMIGTATMPFSTALQISM